MASTYLIPTGQQIREQRRSLRLTQAELADKIKQTRSLIGKIEKEEVDTSVSIMRKIIFSLWETNQDNEIYIGPDRRRYRSSCLYCREPS